MQDNPLVSIVIPVYNGSNYMREAIDSALAQTYPNIEIIVVNDGSTDNTREIALSYGDKIRYFEKENGGVSTALNLAIKNMNGEYFSWLSHDDVYYPNKVEAEIEALLENGDMNMAVHSGWERIHMAEKRTVPYAFLKKDYSETFFTCGLLAVVFSCISGCSLLIPRSYFEEYRAFDENLRAVQDYKKWFEMFHDKRILYVDKILTQVRRHSEQVTYIYNLIDDEGEFLFWWMMQNITEKDVGLIGMELYQFFSAALMRMRCDAHHRAMGVILSRLRNLPETCDAEACKNKFISWLQRFGGNRIYIYCAGRYGKALVEAFYLRGIVVDGIVDSNQAHWGEKIGAYKCKNPECLLKTDTIIIAKNESLLLKEALKKEGFQYLITFERLEEQLFFVPIKKHLLFT